MSDDNDDGNIPAPRLAIAPRPLAGRQSPCFLWILTGSLCLSTSP